MLAPLKKGKGKKAGGRWAVGQVRDGADDLFKVDIQAHYFENEIHHEQCGKDSYTGNTKENRRGCDRFIDDVVDQVTKRISNAFAEANKEPRAMATYLKERFSTYSMWRNVETLPTKRAEVQEKLFQNLKNSLVSKAYADGNCFVRCGSSSTFRDDAFGPHLEFGDQVCQTVCYDPIEDKFERLYGFSGQSNGSQSPAAQSPWSLSERSIGKSQPRPQILPQLTPRQISPHIMPTTTAAPTATTPAPSTYPPTPPSPQTTRLSSPSAPPRCPSPMPASPAPATTPTAP